MVKQKNEPKGFQISEYEKLKKVYSICKCKEHDNKKNYVINMYFIHETCMKKVFHTPKETFDLMPAVIIYPGKEYEHNKDNHIYCIESKMIPVYSSSFLYDKYACMCIYIVKEF